MEPTKSPKFLPMLYTLAVAAVIVALALPATRWIVRTQIEANVPAAAGSTRGWLNRELGIKDAPQPTQQVMDSAIYNALREGNQDGSLMFPALLMNSDMSLNADSPHGSDQSMTPLLRSLQNLAMNNPMDTKRSAHFLRHATRNMTVGRNERQNLASNSLSNGKPNAKTEVQPDRADLLEAMQLISDIGEAREPSNAFFPLMKAVALFAAEKDDEALDALHDAAQCPRYDDYANDEAAARNHLAEEAFDEHSVIPMTAQSAGVLMPHYAQMRAATRLAVVSAIEKEARGDIPIGIAIRGDVLKVGKLMRGQARTLIGNLVGSALQATARVRPGGIPQTAPPPSPSATLSQEAHNAEIEARRIADVYRLAAYFERNHRPDLAELVRSETNAAKSLQTLVARSTHQDLMGKEPLFRLGLLHGFGALLLANTGWLALFGGLATFLLSRKAKSLRPALFIVCLWFIIEGIGSVMNALNQFGYVSNFMLLSTLGDGLPYRDMEATMGWLSLLSVAVPAGIAAIACLVSLFHRVPLGLGILRGLRGLCLPAAAVLVLLWVPLLGLISSRETALMQDYQHSLRHEGRDLANKLGMAWDA